MYGIIRLTFLSLVSNTQLAQSFKYFYRVQTQGFTLLNPFVFYSTLDKSHTSCSNVSNNPNEYTKAEFKGRLIYINNSNKHLYDSSIEKLLESDVLGLDTESPIVNRGSKGYIASLIDSHKIPSKSNTPLPCPTLIQISGPNVCIVYNLKSMGIGANDKLPTPLVEVLENPQITKVCHGDSDFYLIKKYFGVECNNTVDLYNVCVSINSKSRSLQGAVGIYMGLYLDKSLQKSNWDSEELTEEQIAYAATDAWISREFLLSLRARYGLPKLLCETARRTDPPKHDEDERVEEEPAQNQENPKFEYNSFTDSTSCPFVSLLNLCLSKGYEFEFNTIEKTDKGVKSVLSVTVFGDVLTCKSDEWHSDLVDARKDAAKKLLELLKSKIKL